MSKETNTQEQPLRLLRNYIAIPAQQETKSGIIITVSEKKQAHSFSLTNEVAFVSKNAEENFGVVPGLHVTFRPTAQAQGKIPFNGKDYLLMDAADVMVCYTKEQVDKESQLIKEAKIASEKEAEIQRKVGLGLISTTDDSNKPNEAVQEFLDKNY